MEVGAVLALAVVPPLAYGAGWLGVGPERYYPTFRYMALATIVRSLQIALPVLYIMSRAGDSWFTFGLRRPRWVVDSLLGLLLPIGAYILYYAASLLVWTAYRRVWGPPSRAVVGPDLTTIFPAARSLVDWGLLVVSSCCNGFTEELVMRAYLIPRLERLLRGTWRALVCTTVLFAAYHAYQGASGVLSALIGGLLYGLVFCRTRRIWPVGGAHALGDIMALTVLSLRHG
jgi:membrane protease YdiL (CAAX protease family)